MNIYNFSVFNCIIFLNVSNGDISDSKRDLLNNKFEINIENYLKNFKPTAYSFCLNISDSCNLMCSYCFNNKKKTS
jgi:sulfatase maturation enzyme AslB (radical SAM superfamily)